MTTCKRSTVYLTHNLNIALTTYMYMHSDYLYSSILMTTCKRSTVYLTRNLNIALTTYMYMHSEYLYSIYPYDDM